MSCRPWWIAFVVLALIVGLVAGYSFAPFTTSTLTASTPSAPVTVAYSVPVAVPAACSAPAACCAAPEAPACCCSKNTSGCCSKGTAGCCSKSQAEAPKQYVHFLIKDIEVKTADATFTLGKVSFMYKGDGIEADVAKAAMGADSSKDGKKVDLSDLADVLGKLTDQLNTMLTSKAGKSDKADEDTDAPKPTSASCAATEECLPAPAPCMASSYEAAPAPCTAAPCGGCETAEKVEGCETETKSPEQVEEAEPETLPAPTEVPADGKIND